MEIIHDFNFLTVHNQQPIHIFVCVNALSVYVLINVKQQFMVYTDVIEPTPY